MTRPRFRPLFAAIACALVIGGASRVFFAMPDGAWRAAEVVGDRFLVARDVPYRAVHGWTGRLDVYRPPGRHRVPAVIYMHGGGWVSGDKRAGAVWSVPFAMSGYAVVSVGYRLAEVAPAPAAIEDVRCAIRWVAAHADAYNIDPDRLITAGESAGGHLALMGALLQQDDGFDAACEGEAPRVRAVLNVAGVTDVEDLLRGMLSGSPARVDWPFAVTWIGQTPDAIVRARRTSPISWVRAQAPPVFTAHGEIDTLVPFRHAVVLHRALDAAAIPNELLALPGRGHGDFTAAEWLRVVHRMRAFLAMHLGHE